jgi:hypothetical protein
MVTNISLLLFFIGQKVLPKSLALMQNISPLVIFHHAIAIEPDKPAKWECEVKGKDKAIALLRKNIFDRSECLV